MHLCMTGDERSITAAISRGQLQQLNRVVKTLVDNHHVRTMIFHWFGNYTLQDLVTATSKLRSTTITILTKMTVGNMTAGLVCKVQPGPDLSECLARFGSCLSAISLWCMTILISDCTVQNSV